MGISILQLSDLHFTQANNSILKKIEKVVDAIKNEIEDSTYLFLVFSGDIAFSGNKSEYEIAERFIYDLKDKISAYVKDIRIELIFTPGNHDCDFSDNQEVRNILIDKILKDPSSITEQLILTCTAVQKDFFEFVEKLNSKENIMHELSNALFRRYNYNIDGYKLAFNSYNLAWVSKKNESQSEIVYPTSFINKSDISNDEYDLTISLFHHPLHWLEHSNMRQFKELINSTSNIVLSGHEHTHSAKKESKINNENHIEYIESGVLQDLHD
ncbi:metallophosphoesterase, partial [bacterium]|nr:metallophosphoesterase [bacterium]